MPGRPPTARRMGPGITGLPNDGIRGSVPGDFRRDGLVRATLAANSSDEDAGWPLDTSMTCLPDPCQSRGHFCSESSATSGETTLVVRTRCSQPAVGEDGAMATRLRGQTSPYLLQHAGNPVDWWPWSDEAFVTARERDVPVLLSVGYSACHWCHVMAHESFEDEQTAAIMNEYLVSIKVDREERPDVDSVYMTATQAMTGQGGWPMTVFMTPDKEPFFAGTYLPRDRFQQLILGVAQAWRDQRDGVTGQARHVATALAENAAAVSRALRGPTSKTDTETRFRDVTRASVSALERDYDPPEGGFGRAPKFPPSMVLEFLLRHHHRTKDPVALRMAEGTCEAMARGGMYDQLLGGFARYSTDNAWVVPHFERMLYDNALLARVYLNLWRATGSELARRVALETCTWMVHDMRTADGGLAAVGGAH